MAICASEAPNRRVLHDSESRGARGHEVAPTGQAHRAARVEPGGVRRACGREPNGPKGRDKGAAGLLWLFLFPSEFLIHFPFIFSSELNSNSNPI